MELLKLTDIQDLDDLFEMILTDKHIYRNISTIGSNGSGKSSGFLLSMSLALARKEFSIVVPVAKTDELERWQKIHKVSKTSGAFINWDKNSGLKFDPLLYLSRIEGGMDTYNIVSLFISITKTISRISGFDGGFGNDSFWIRSVTQVTTTGIDLLKLSGEDVSFQNIYTLLSDMYVYKATRKNPDVNQFPYFWECKMKAQAKNALGKNKDLLNHTLKYIESNFINTPEKTSGNIQALVMGMLDPFVTGTLRDIMVGEVSEELVPENILKNGSILLINFPLLSQFEVAGIIQSIYMQMFCQAVERRDLSNCDRGSCLLVDEAHYHLSDHLVRTMSTGRSKRLSIVLASQSISGYYANMQGQKYRQKVDAMMATCDIKVLCNANDFETLEYYMRTVGKGTQRIQDRKIGGDSFYYREKYFLEHTDFKRLSTGGKDNDYITEAIIVMSGLPEGRHYMKCAFDQRLLEG